MKFRVKVLYPKLGRRTKSVMVLKAGVKQCGKVGKGNGELGEK